MLYNLSIFKKFQFFNNILKIDPLCFIEKYILKHYIPFGDFLTSDYANRNKNKKINIVDKS